MCSKHQGSRKGASRQVSIPYEQQLEYRHTTKSSPAVRLAARAYAAGVVRTKKEAARLAGVSVVHFSNLTRERDGSEPIKRLMSDTEQTIADETITTSALIQKLGRMAVGKLGLLMQTSDSEMIQLKAAQDLADRSPETSKTQKHEILAAHIEPADAKELAKALVDSARAQQRYAEAATGDYIRVDQASPGPPPAALPSANRPPGT